MKGAAAHTNLPTNLLFLTLLLLRYSWRVPAARHNVRRLPCELRQRGRLAAVPLPRLQVAAAAAPGIGPGQVRKEPNCITQNVSYKMHYRGGEGGGGEGGRGRKAEVQ